MLMLTYDPFENANGRRSGCRPSPSCYVAFPVAVPYSDVPNCQAATAQPLYHYAVLSVFYEESQYSAKPLGITKSGAVFSNSLGTPEKLVSCPPNPLTPLGSDPWLAATPRRLGLAFTLHAPGRPWKQANQ